MTLSAERHELSRARMPLGHFARAVGLTTGRVSQLRAEGAIVGAQVGRGFEVDVRATLERCGRPEWVWVGAPAEAPDKPPASVDDGWIEIRGKRIPLSVPAASASAVAAALLPGAAVGGLTKGQFSLLDLLRALLDRTGPADVTIAAWTTGIRDAEVAAWLVQTGAIRSLRWVLDRSFATRQPEYAALVAERFGAAAIRTVETHAKFLIIRNAGWAVVVRSSMNLNRNARWEQYDIDDSVALADHYDALVEQLVAGAPEGYGDKRSGVKALQESMGGDNAPPDVYASTESAEKLGARDAPALPAVATMVARETGRKLDAPPAAEPTADTTTAGDYYTARARREVANASLAEIRLAEARRELRSASSVRAYCGDVGVAFRERMLAIESSAATRLDAADQVWLAAEIRRALSECADTLDRATERLLEGASLTPAGVDGE